MSNLLEDIKNLKYPIHKLEVLMIDNESKDNSAIIIRNYIFENNSKIIIHNSLGSKKDAVWKGINESVHDYIISLDGDCRIPQNLLKDFDAMLQKKSVKLISGPVSFYSKGDLWGKFMEFEFMSLIASGAGAIGIGMPIMVNAANMLFERKMALKAEHIYKSNEESGDDIFLLNYVVKNYGSDQVKFLKSKQSVVRTAAPKDIKSWVHQRLRWTAKAKSYSINATSITALLILSFNLLPIVLLGMSFINSWYIIALGLILIFKSLADFTLLSAASNFFSKKHLLKYLLFFEIIYPFYIVLIGFVSLFHKKEWKDET